MCVTPARGMVGWDEMSGGCVMCVGWCVGDDYAGWARVVEFT